MGACSAEARADLPPADMAAALERWKPRLASKTVLTALKAAAHHRAQLVVPGDPAWPEGLDDLGPHSPIALWIRGDPSLLRGSGGSVALVGSRDATNYGEHVAMDLAAGLSDRGFSIVSGAAYGIDGMAHRAALASGGTTVAFLAGGVDRLYPSGHGDLLRRIIASGAVVSELPCGAAPTRWRFLQRNRLIAATAVATVVVEAGHRSGSLNTAGHAAALGRALGAVPGPVTSANSAGCHRLLREYDAVCVTSAAEVAELALGRLNQEPPLLDGLVGDPRRSPSTGAACSPDTRVGLQALPVAASAPTSAATSPAPTAAGSSPGQWATSRRPDTPVAAAVLSRPSLGAAPTRVHDALSRRSARDVADLARRSGLGLREVEAALGALSLEGTAREVSSGWLRS
jgi:DNA processing protein